MKIDTIKPIKISEIEKKKKLARLIQNGYVIEYGFTLNPAGEVAVREYPVFKQILKKECPRVNIFVDDQETKSIIEAKKETASIIDIYQLLMYCDGYCLDNVFNHIPVQLAKENKKYAKPFVQTLFSKNNELSSHRFCLQSVCYQTCFVNFIRCFVAQPLMNPFTIEELYKFPETFSQFLCA